MCLPGTGKEIAVNLNQQNERRRQKCLHLLFHMENQIPEICFTEYGLSIVIAKIEAYSTSYKEKSSYEAKSFSRNTRRQWKILPASSALTLAAGLF